MKQGRFKYQKSAIRIIEEAVHILRSAPGVLLPSYFLGGVPFVLGLLYFWADMSRSARANEHSAAAAAGLAFLFVWMKFWHTVFAFRVRTRISGEPHERWALRRIGSIAATQSLIQSTRFIVMPVASVMVIPFGFCYAFYQNATVHVEGEIQNVTSTCKWAWRLAKLWPRQNHLLIGIFWLFGTVIFLNASFAAFMIPQLIKTSLGIDSVFTLSGMRMIFNSTFWMTMLGVTYLFLDPFIKTAYVLRCFYGSALQSGQDLKAELSWLRPSAKKMAAWTLIIALSGISMPSFAQERSALPATELNASIEEVMGRREFAWRMPRETIQDEEQQAKGPIETAIEWVLDILAKGFRILRAWVANFFEWLEGLLPQQDNKAASADKNWMTPVRLAFVLLLFLLLVFLAFLFWRIRQRRSSGSNERISAVPGHVPDLSGEEVKADELPAQRWLMLAKELTEKGDLRLAMRALHLATLAQLAEREMITIEIYKSNREYERELNRRAYKNKELLLVFAKSLSVFERVWYGMHRITPSGFSHFAANQKRMMAFAEK